MFTLLVAFFVAPAVANTPGVACEFHTIAIEGCGPDRDENVANCVIVKNDTRFYAEVGIKGLCPVGSGTAIARPPNGLPLYIDGNPADPTVGARNVIEPHGEAYLFLRPQYGSPNWAVPRHISVEARLFSQVTAGVVTNAQFVPSLTAVATTTSGGPVGAGYFCQPLDMMSVFNYATIRRENYCD